MAEKIPKDEVMRRCHEEHGSTYEFDFSDFKNSQSNVNAKCEKHGWFSIRVNRLMRGKGCQKCVTEELTRRRRKPFGSFIEEASRVHENRYSYAESTYVDDKTKTRIVCDIHGPWMQSPNNHLKGKGCPKCRYITISKKTRKSKAEFVRQAVLLHGDKYRYDEVVYKKAKAKVTISCLECDAVFTITPDKHLQGQGCPHCVSSRGETLIRSWLLAAGIQFEQQKKFPGCRRDKPLRFDFYIESLLLAIEFDGRQHHGEGNYWPNFSFADQQERDQIKTEYCEGHGIRLVRITNKEIRKIPEILQRVTESDLIKL